MELLNPNLRFSIYKNNKIQQITYQDLFTNRRVLICSAVRPWQLITNQYIEYLIEEAVQYKTQNIDEVYIVNSSDGLFVLAQFDKIYPQIPALYDSNCDFVSYLKETQNKQQDLDKLSKYWSYQVLINNGQIEKFYEQPTEKYVKNIIDSGYKLHLGNHKLFAVEKESVVLHRPTLGKQEQRFEMVNIEEKNR
jgi:peroxiredoxin